ncbi:MULTISPECIES: hypothetical protein [Chitinophagaceae]
MKRLNLYCFIGGLLLVLVGIARIIHFIPTLDSTVNTGMKIGEYIGMAIIPLFGILMLIESIRQFKLDN